MKQMFKSILALGIAGILFSCNNDSNNKKDGGRNSLPDSSVTTKSTTTDAAPTADIAKEEQTVRQTISDLEKALQTNNADELDRIYSDNFTFVSSEGKRVTKSERLADFRSGKNKYQSINIRVDDLKIVSNTAVAFLDVTVNAVIDGKKDDGHFHTTGTFIKSNGRWVELAASNIRLAK